MARAVWSGAISFGLVNIPVEVMGAQDQKSLSFHLLDATDNSPIGYKKINKTTGREVSPKKIVKGYEYEPHKFVIVTDEDFRRANPKATQTIDIEDFIDVGELDILMYEKPYYLVPSKTGRKGYVLLRKVLQETGKVAMARFVMRSKQHLVAIIPRGDYLILETLRYAHEVKEVENAEFLDDAEISKIRITPKELSMAEALVKGMTTAWKPEKYKDTYQDDLLKMIKLKVKNGDTEELNEPEQESYPSSQNVVNLMPLLQKSLERSKSAAGGASSKAKANVPKKGAGKPHAKLSAPRGKGGHRQVSTGRA